MLDYSGIKPIGQRIPAERQSAKRHYGVHPYFTRRPHNVIRKYILHYSRENDIVLDPFGGSGVTAIESFLENRAGIHNDINPLANFIAQGIADLSKGNINEYKNALLDIMARCENRLSRINASDDFDLEGIAESSALPPNVVLPSNSDVEHYYDLFSPKQLASLAILKKAIDDIPITYCRSAMLLAWSATLGKLNKTFLSAEGRAESRGGSSIFSIFRYKIARKPVELPPWNTFYERAMNVIAAKEEIDKAIELKNRTGGWTGRFIAYSFDIDALSQEFSGKVDYIFTDPPYGSHIAYIDLSTIWNSWLGFSLPLQTRKRELIVGGELKLRESDYISRLHESIRACARMLKPNRWFSVVFQHWNVDYFRAILEGAEAEGAHLRAAISQIGDPIWSMHKKKNKESVLSGELILTFIKSGGHLRPCKKKRSFDVAETTKRILDAIDSDYVHGEYLFDRLIVEAWENSSIEDFNLDKDTFVEILHGFGWRYDPRKHYWVRNETCSTMLFDT